MTMAPGRSSIVSRAATRLVAGFQRSEESNGVNDHTAVSTPQPHRAWWLALATIGSMLVVAGTFLPVAHLQMLSGPAFSRTEWQLGPNASVTFAGAPILLIDVVVVLMGFFAIEGVIGPARSVRGRRTSLAFLFWLLIWTATDLKSTFPGTWTVPALVTRGVGGWVSALGLAVLAGVYVAEVCRYGLSREPDHEPLDDRERRVLARSERWPFRWVLGSAVGGAVVALAMKFVVGWSWPLAALAFVSFGTFCGWQMQRRLKELRRRRGAEVKESSSTT